MGKPVGILEKEERLVPKSPDISVMNRIRLLLEIPMKKGDKRAFQRVLELLEAFRELSPFDAEALLKGLKGKGPPPSHLKRVKERFGLLATASRRKLLGVLRQQLVERKKQELVEALLRKKFEAYLSEAILTFQGVFFGRAELPRKKAGQTIFLFDGCP